MANKENSRTGNQQGSQGGNKNPATLPMTAKKPPKLGARAASNPVVAVPANRAARAAVRK